MLQNTPLVFFIDLTLKPTSTSERKQKHSITLFFWNSLIDKAIDIDLVGLVCHFITVLTAIFLSVCINELYTINTHQY